MTTLTKPDSPARALEAVTGAKLGGFYPEVVHLVTIIGHEVGEVASNKQIHLALMSLPDECGDRDQFL